mmetsp:Transcript_21160/g.50287  ORF Transcript_21160/g.50287 Transcript_21160/m.50287 type:complete len:496 (-) Transcript_21160:80-1567(-)
MVQPLRSSFILVPTSSSQSSSSLVGGSSESESSSPSSQQSSSSFSSSPPSNHLPVGLGKSKLTVILRPKTSTNPRLEEWARKFELEKQQHQWHEDLRYDDDDDVHPYEHQQEREQEHPSQKRDAPAAEEVDSDNRVDIHSSNKRQKKVSELSSSSYDDVNLSSSSSSFPPVRLSFRGQGRQGQNRQQKHDRVDPQTRRQNLPVAFALGSSSVPFPSSLMKKGQTLSKQPLFPSSSSKNLDHNSNINHPTTDGLLYREFLPPQDYNGGGKYWKDRCIFMQTIVKDTRKQVRDLEEDQRQLRARVHELEEQLLLQGGGGGRGSSSSSSSSSRHFVDVGSDHDGDDNNNHDDAGDDCQGHYGTNNHNEIDNDGEKTDRGEDGNGQSTHPKTTKKVSNDHMDHINEPPVPERCPSQLRMEGGRTKRVSIDAAADAAPGDRREGSSSSSFPPSVVVTCAQQHRVVSSCLYMTDGEGLSDDDNNDNGDECDSIVDESSSVM